MKITVGARGSLLSTTQVALVVDALSLCIPNFESTFIPITTSGDKRQTKEQKVSDKFEWVLEIEQALLAGKIDLAIHSAKDVPVEIAPKTEISPVLPRATPMDVLVVSRRISESCSSIEASVQKVLSAGAVIGTSSLRRKAELLRMFPGVQVTEFGGNVPTRIEKLDSGAADAMVIAAAGLQRLSLEDRIAYVFSPHEMLPAVNQGILVVQYRSVDSELRDIVSSISLYDVIRCFQAERKLVATLGADCRSCVGVLADCVGPELRLRARVLSPDGGVVIEGEEQGESPQQLGTKLGARLLQKGARGLLSGFIECDACGEKS